MLEQIRTFLRRKPFQPFEIHCSSGEVYRVEHPENAAVVGSYVVVGLPGSDQAIMISALHISAVSGASSIAA